MPLSQVGGLGFVFETREEYVQDKVDAVVPQNTFVLESTVANAPAPTSVLPAKVCRASLLVTAPAYVDVDCFFWLTWLLSAPPGRSS